MDDTVNQKDLAGGADLVKYILDGKADQLRVVFTEVVLTAFLLNVDNAQEKAVSGSGGDLMVECGIFAFTEVFIRRLMEKGVDLFLQCVRSVLLLQLFSGSDIPAYFCVQFYLCEQFIHLLFQILV